MIDGGALGLLSLDSADVPRMRELMRKYRDLPMDVAEAALVRIADRRGRRGALISMGCPFDSFT
ncbi:MAG: hypothetical protein HYU24_15230 [Candidatus Rokubacteria bacterium]|nr:hypothetical protein [Candidatus Rokubacteria bacterium]